jgi:hypothetical protein
MIKLTLFFLFLSAATAFASEPVVITLPYGTDLIVVQSDEEIPLDQDGAFIIKSKYDDIQINIKGQPKEDNEDSE